MRFVSHPEPNKSPHTFPFFYFKIHLVLSFQLYVFQMIFFISGFHSKFPSAMRFTNPTHFIPLNLIIVLILDKECKL